MIARRLLLACAAAALATALLAPAAQGAFGLKGLDVTFSDMRAGSHPFAWTTTLAVNTKPGGEIGFDVPDGSVKDLQIDVPPGVAGNPSATTRCTTVAFLGVGQGPECPLGSQVGVTEVTYSQPTITERFPVYNLVPPPGVPARLGFQVADHVPVTIEAGINPEPPYNIVASLRNISQALPFYAATTTIWGDPSDPGHNAERRGCVGECAAGLSKVAFITAPRACEGPLATVFKADPWESPGVFVEPPPVLTHDDSAPPRPLGFGECDKLGFAPHISAAATSRAASAPSGLDVDLNVEDEELLNPDGTADSDIKKVVLTLPKGMTANPSLAEGLATCSSAAFASESLQAGPGEGCPEASKIGAVEAETPLLEGEVLKGQLFIASQNDNPFHSLLALYMVIKDPGIGVLVKLAGKVEPDPVTGQLTTIFGEPGQEVPQVPVSHVHVHLREGARSPLITPPLCGTYRSEAIFTPWANPSHPLEASAPFTITQGVDGGACPSGGTPPFEPGFEAGTIDNSAGSYSPFHMRLTRRDGDQELTRFSAKLPPGVVASLAGVARCPEAAIAAARTKSGREELASPSCPASSEIGHVSGGAGVGSELTYVPGKLYLAGPYKGAPLSVVAVVPAVAGPFDVGDVVVREALRIDPRTAEVTADGASSDPLPHILAGIPLSVRDIRVDVDRPHFTLNPTNCSRFQTLATIWGGGADPFSTLDDVPLSRSARFQAADCAALAFKPRLFLRLKGGTRRGAHPALRGVFAPRPGDANLAGLVVRLPHSAFLDQAHIRTICTRVQFAASACPPGAVYGHVRAFTPLLDEPLEGPVYLRSSNHNLPDFVADLHGLIDIEAVARIDSKHGGIRATFEDTPDAPLTKVIVNMQGGKKGLIINSRNLCAAKSRADTQFSGQNGRRYASKPQVRATGCSHARHKKRHPRHRRR